MSTRATQHKGQVSLGVLLLVIAAIAIALPMMFAEQCAALLR